ncbi:hypothetical protein [Pseudomonas monteilii]|uniref:hypothetical protein n=1 Tax=Pseudomonas monteilii TaxID=76759 RepID=UPI0018AC81C3|nr:hypothetical protein [Pseudomonas monteilii]MBF8746896.1 hypothetical protein [Pseudomonas monteilii]
MRVSKITGDPDYNQSFRAHVWLDGQKLERVISFDDANGVVVVTKVDAAGNVVIQGGAVVTEELRGVVTYEEIS